MVVLCLVLAGCNGLDGGLWRETPTDVTETTDTTQTTGTSSTAVGTDTTQTATRTNQTTTVRTDRPAVAPSPENHTDPPEDVLGWENGYWYDEPIAVDASDGLSNAEIEPLLGRAMARVEYLRQREFTRDVTVRTLTRDEFRRAIARDNSTSVASGQSLNRYYETLFLVGEDTDATTVVNRNNAASVLGFYLPGSDTIWLLSNESDALVADESLFVHELTHVLQDEYDRTLPLDSTSDQSMAYRSLVEGEARYVEARFREQCASGAWECVEKPAKAQSSITRPSHPGVAALGYFPYSDGPAFVHDLYANGYDGQTGWDAVDSAFVNPPHSTAQVAHPGRYPNDDSDRLSVDVNPQNGWVRTSVDTYGEAALFSMFWYQHYERDVEVVDNRSFFRPDGGQHDQFNYTSAPSEGWRGDRIVTVTNGEQSGYVWTLQWETERDARQFYDAYLTLLASYGAERVDENVWEIPGGGFEDAYAVTREGTTVTVVNGPSVEDLNDISPSVAEDG